MFHDSIIVPQKNQQSMWGHLCCQHKKFKNEPIASLRRKEKEKQQDGHDNSQLNNAAILKKQQLAFLGGDNNKPV